MFYEICKKKFVHTVKFSYLINIKYIQYQHKNVSYVKWIHKMGRITMNLSNILSYTRQIDFNSTDWSEEYQQKNINSVTVLIRKISM